MKMELNRRIFLALLGTATVAASTSARPKAGAAGTTAIVRRPDGLHFFSDAPCEPTARPRSAAIQYYSI
ncbi:hypothetical protein [Pontiella sulfatireligans]|uniref:Uncharacterized protein n=1 Tax=Pontiella sulfatireligans TaxID=2750658 RepID=A0A6C2UND9_9BACT|nr:hypothetical protein [Pontiella sulfatireligans]VGO21579.1 hypothetical protein SCARR_03653 [Pontiella sulfatireligans]